MMQYWCKMDFIHLHRNSGVEVLWGWCKGATPIYRGLHHLHHLHPKCNLHHICTTLHHYQFIRKKRKYKHKILLIWNINLDLKNTPDAAAAISARSVENVALLYTLMQQEKQSMRMLADVTTKVVAAIIKHQSSSLKHTRQRKADSLLMLQSKQSRKKKRG